jgi:hypothetical protein
MTDWKLGQYVRVWRGGSVGEHDAGGYEYGHIETVETKNVLNPSYWLQNDDVMLVGDSGKEIYCQVKDLEAG